MAQRHKKAKKAKPKKTKPKTPKQLTALSAKEYGVPFWILWGIAGAESTWGQGGSNLFGLLDAAEGADVSNWRSASKQAAKTLAGLKKQYGSWPQAIEHYSGYSYNIQHPKELAADKGVTPQNSAKVQQATLENVIWQPPLLESIEPWEWFKSDPGETPLGKEAERLTNPLGTVEESIGGVKEDIDAISAVFRLLSDPHFWIRAAEAVGGMILLYMALKALTGSSLSDVPGASTASSAAKAAAFKRLPPKQRVK